MSWMAHIFGYGPKYRAPGILRLRVTTTRGASSPSVTARYGYDLSSLNCTLNGGLKSLIHVILELQRLELAADDRPLDRRGRRDHAPGAFVQGAQRREVVAQPRSEVLGLADVEHATLGITEAVHTGLRSGSRPPSADTGRRVLDGAVLIA